MDIVADMLAIIQEKEKIKPTHLMYKSNLSHGRMQTYLDELIEKNIVDKIQGKKGHDYLILTEEGHKVLNKLSEMRSFQETFGL